MHPKISPKYLFLDRLTLLVHERMEEYMTNFIIIENSSYVWRDSIPKSCFFTKVVPNLDERRFKILARMSYQNFNKIIDVIINDPVFSGKNCEKQFPIYQQLLLVLYRLGSCGEANTVGKIAFLFGIGDGGTLDKITKRVFKAILRLKDSYINWPTHEERLKICQETMHELPHCVGYIDGTEIKLAEKPSFDHESYFSRKHVYSIKVQAVCDYKLKIRHLVCGYPGSVHDARIYSNCALATKSEEFLSGSQYLAGDSAYKLSKTLITPYRANSNIGTVQERNMFNYHFGKYRIRIENTFGMLKERFNCLKELRTQIGSELSIALANCYIYVCCILHNIIEEEMCDVFEFAYEEDSAENDTSERFNSTEAENKRRSILEFIRLQNN